MAALLRWLFVCGRGGALRPWVVAWFRVRRWWWRLLFRCRWWALPLRMRRRILRGLTSPGFLVLVLLAVLALLRRWGVWRG
ncbi:hypothetical protein ACW73L_19495 [Methylolobus aquaticus]